MLSANLRQIPGNTNPLFRIMAKQNIMAAKAHNPVYAVGEPKYVDSYDDDKFAYIEYHFDCKDKTLMMDAPRLIDLLYKTDLIMGYQEGHDLRNSIVMFDEVDDPKCPEECEEKPKVYMGKMSLSEFWDTLTKREKLKIVKYHEFQLARQKFENFRMTFQGFCDAILAINI